MRWKRANAAPRKAPRPLECRDTAVGGDAMNQDIEIVDRGRGLQFSTSRVTVQDLVPYFQDSCSDEEIIRWIPTLTHEEIAVIERYYREHQPELDEEDVRIRARTEERIRQQRLRFPGEPPE